MVDAPKITDVRIHLVKGKLDDPIVAPFGIVSVRHNLLLAVHLDDGAVGYGEVWANFPPWGCPERVEILRNVVRPALMGRSLDSPEAITESLSGSARLLANQMGARGPFEQALAGMDIALWDALAHSRGGPLRRLVADDCERSSARVYATNLPMARAAEMIGEMAAMGHVRFKVKLPQDVDLARRGLKAAREAAGDRPLMTDASQGYSLERLVSIADVLNEVKLDWLEEPMPVHEAEPYARWRARPDRPPLALGENSYGADGFETLLADFDPDVAQPDITKTGGITLGRRLVAMSAARGKRVCLHMYGGPLGLYASAQLAAALSEVDLVEMDSKKNPLFDVLLAEPPSVVDGEVQLSDAPGLGVTLNQRVLEEADVTEG